MPPCSMRALLFAGRDTQPCRHATQPPPAPLLNPLAGPQFRHYNHKSRTVKTYLMSSNRWYPGAVLFAPGCHPAVAALLPPGICRLRRAACLKRHGNQCQERSGQPVLAACKRPRRRPLANEHLLPAPPARIAGVATLPDGKVITVGGVLKSGVGGWGAVGKVSVGCTSTRTWRPWRSSLLVARTAHG